jgi:hypothetical protein
MHKWSEKDKKTLFSLPQTATLYPALILLNDQTSLSQ